jgi:hypothetical protein
MVDNNLQYEINYSTAELTEDGWMPKPPPYYDDEDHLAAYGRPLTKIALEPNQNYNIAIRAKDDFGNISEAATTTFSVPDAIPPYGITGINWGYLTSTSTAELNFNSNPYPFMTEGVPSTMVFFLNQSPPISFVFQDNESEWNTRIKNKILRLGYDSLNYDSNYPNYPALVFNNSLAYPDVWGWSLKKMFAMKNVSFGQNSFKTNVVGIYDNGSMALDYSFSSSDYITVGFYEFSKRYYNSYEQVAAYNKKIYFQE